MAYDIELAPKVTDESGLLDLEKKIKEIEEEGINLKVKINADESKSSKEIEKNNAAISKLIQQLNTLVEFDDKKLIKTVDVTVDVKNFNEEIAKGLKTLTELNPSIAINTDKLEKRFKELRNLYTKQLTEYEEYTEPMFDQSFAKDKLGYKLYFNEAVGQAKSLYNTCKSIDYLLSKDSTLEIRLGDPKKEYYSARDTLSGMTTDFRTFAEYLSMTDKQTEKTINTIIGKRKELSDADVFNLNSTQQIQAKTKNAGKSLENLGDQTESFIERFQTAIINLHSAMDSVGKDTKSIADNIEKLETILDQMNQAVQQIKSPFDETSISNTATRLEELFKQYNSLDGTEKEMKIGVEISSEDEQKLENVAKYADEIKSVMRNITTYKAIGSGQDSQGNNKSSKKKEQKESTDSQSGVANKESKKAVAETNKAVEAYDKLVPKEVKITLNVENLGDLETAVNHIKELDQRNESIAQDAVTSVKPKIQSGVFKSSNAQGNSTPNNGTGDGGNNDALKGIGDNIDKSVKLMGQAVDEFNSLLRRFSQRFPVSNNNQGQPQIAGVKNTSLINQGESDLARGNEIATNSLLNNIKDDIGQASSDINGVNDKLKTVSESINQSSESEADPVTKGFIGGMYAEMQNRVSNIISLLGTIDAKLDNKSEVNNQQSEDTITNSFLEDIRDDIEQVSLYVNEINEKQSSFSTLIDPKLTAIQGSVSNIYNKFTNGKIKNDSIENKSNSGKDTGKSKKIESSTKSNSGVKSKDNTSVIKDKLNNLPTKLNSLQQTNSSISKNTKAIQTNTGKISTKAGTINNTIKSKAGEISAQLSSIDTHVSQGNTPASPNAATKNDYTNLETAIKALTQTLSTPTATGSAQNAQNNATAPSTAQAAANLANASSLQTQATNRIKELQTVLGFMNGGSFSSIFGSTQDIESYIVSLETLNKEIASAGKMLNRNDISAAQRSNVEQKLSTNTAILNGYINGDDSLGINATQIANINALLQAMTTINSRITGADAAFEGLTKLKETLKSYDITVQPLQAAIDNLKATRENLKQMSDKISSSSLTEQEFANLQTAITSAETSYQEAINKSNELLNTNQKDSLQSITSEFNQAQQEVTKYSAKIEKLKNFLRDLKAKKIDLSTIDMGNGRTAKDMEAFLADYEKAIALKHNFNSTQEMQTYAANFAANYQTPLKQYVDGLGEANRQFKNMTQAASESIQHNNFGKQLADFTTSVKKWGDTNGGVFSRAEFKDRYNKIMTELTSGSVQSADQLARLRSEFANLKLAANQAGVATKSFTAKLKEMYKKYGGWTLVTKTLNTAMRLLRSMVTQVKEVDTAMTNLKKVTEATGNQLNTFLESAGKRSVALGASLTDYVDAVSEFSRLGKNLDEAQKLGELATTYKTVAEDLDIKTASKSIISTMQAFNSVGVQADEIVDKFNYVGKMLPLITISVKVQRWIRPS